MISLQEIKGHLAPVRELPKVTICYGQKKKQNKKRKHESFFVLICSLVFIAFYTGYRGTLATHSSYVNASIKYVSVYTCSLLCIKFYTRVYGADEPRMSQPKTQITHVITS